MARHQIIMQVCDRCIGDEPVTQTRFMCDGDERIRFEFCDYHAERFDIDMAAWKPYGEVVAEHRPVIKFGQKNLTAADRRVIPIPRRVVQPEPEEEPEPANAGGVPTPLPRRTPQPMPDRRFASMPPGGHEWGFSAHALDRIKERGLDKLAVLWAAVRPDLSSTGKLPGTMQNQLGDIIAVVQSDDRLVITAYRDGVDNREMEQA